MTIRKLWTEPMDSDNKMKLHGHYWMQSFDEDFYVWWYVQMFVSPMNPGYSTCLSYHSSVQRNKVIGDSIISGEFHCDSGFVRNLTNFYDRRSSYMNAINRVENWISYVSRNMIQRKSELNYVKSSNPNIQNNNIQNLSRVEWVSLDKNRSIAAKFNHLHKRYKIIGQ